MKSPPEHPENDHSDLDYDDPENKILGPSQSDIDRSWDGYESNGGAQKIGGMAWKATIVIVSIVILASMSIGIFGPLLNGDRSAEPTPPDRVSAQVLRVIDGRTIVVDAGNGEQTVRLIGIESPPYGDQFYDFAQQVTQSWIDNKEVLLESDERDGDEQGRLLRYVFIGNVMINAALLLNGLGNADIKHPNTRYDGYFAEMERQAQESGIGIWDDAFGGDMDAGDPQAMSPLSVPADITAN